MARAVDGVTEDRRRALRRPLGALPWLTAARLWPGRAIDVINWSSGGMLIETNARLAPGRAVVLQLLADRGHLLINGQVARASIVTITSEAGIRCRGAVVFERSVDFCRPPERAGPKIPAPRKADDQRLDLRVDATRVRAERRGSGRSKPD